MFEILEANVFLLIKWQQTNSDSTKRTIFPLRQVVAHQAQCVTIADLCKVHTSHFCRVELNLRTFAPIATAHLKRARYTWRGACHVMYFKRAHRVETQQNIELVTFAVTWSANISVGCSVTPTFFQQITSFSDSFHYTKKQKKSVRGKF